MLRAFKSKYQCQSTMFSQTGNCLKFFVTMIYYFCIWVHIFWLHKQAEKQSTLEYGDGIPECCIIFFENTVSIFPLSPSKEYEIQVIELFFSLRKLSPCVKHLIHFLFFFFLTTFHSYSFPGQVYKQPLKQILTLDHLQQ